MLGVLNEHEMDLPVDAAGLHHLDPTCRRSEVATSSDDREGPA